jgi:Rrf2 family protein
MLMTRASRLAIEALVELADLPPQEWVGAEALSGRTTGDLPFVKQVLRRLAGTDMVRSKLGRGGGYRLAKNPKSITLKMVVDTIDGRGLERCMLDSTLCDGAKRCRLERTWHPIRSQLLSFLEEETIHSIAARSRGAVDRFDLSELDG